MTFRRMRVWFAGFVLLCAGLAQARALILPDVERQLEKAREAVSSGGWNYAWAYADTVLLNGEITVAWEGGADPQARESLETAMRIWSEALGWQTRFVIMDDASQADIRVQSVRDLTHGGRPVAGHISWRRSVRPTIQGDVIGRTTATVRLAQTGPRGELLNQDQMVHAALHELGHFLGLNDSRRGGRAMSLIDLRRPVKAPHPDEVRALMDVREEGLRVQASADAWLK